MPHLTVEYSDNLEDQADIQGLCDRLLEAMLASGLFEVGAVRVRAVRCTHYAIADRLPQNAFVDLSVRIGAGRTQEAKESLVGQLMAAMGHHLQALFLTPHFALSVELREIDPNLSRKRNSMHQRLRTNQN